MNTVSDETEVYQGDYLALSIDVERVNETERYLERCALEGHPATDCSLITLLTNPSFLPSPFTPNDRPFLDMYGVGNHSTRYSVPNVTHPIQFDYSHDHDVSFGVSVATECTPSVSRSLAYPVMKTSAQPVLGDRTKPE